VGLVVTPQQVGDRPDEGGEVDAAHAWKSPFSQESDKAPIVSHKLRHWAQPRAKPRAHESFMRCCSPATNSSLIER
jgi:hypothetical protein